MELLVAAPTQMCGQGRPRVLYDITCVLRTLGISIFKVTKIRCIPRDVYMYMFLCVYYI